MALNYNNLSDNHSSSSYSCRTKITTQYISYITLQTSAIPHHFLQKQVRRFYSCFLLDYVAARVAKQTVATYVAV